jgi:hypothetical protein
MYSKTFLVFDREYPAKNLLPVLRRVVAQPRKPTDSYAPRNMDHSTIVDVDANDKKSKSNRGPPLPAAHISSRSNSLLEIDANATCTSSLQVNSVS